MIYSTDADFLRLIAECLQRGEFFPGLAYHAQNSRTKRQVIDALVLLDVVYGRFEMHNRVEFI